MQNGAKGHQHSFFLKKKFAIRKLRFDHPKAINVPHNWVRRTNTFWDYIGDRELDVFRYMSTENGFGASLDSLFSDFW